MALNDHDMSADEDAVLWIGATDEGWAPWLAPGGREDGGVTTSPDARRMPTDDFMRKEGRRGDR
jgi:hypothetical protein